MSKRSHICASTLLLLTVLSSAFGFDCFVLLDNIPGESKDPWHTNWIEARIVASEVSQASVFGRADFQLNFTKATDKSSPLLALRCADHRRIDRAGIEFVRDFERRVRFYRISLTNVYVINFVQSADASSQSRPTETLSLSFESISWTYTEMDKSGIPLRNLGAYWDLTTARGGSGAGPLVSLTASKEGADMVIRWAGRAGATYKVLGSAQAIGPYAFLQNVTPASNATVRVSFPISSANLFFQVETASESP